MPWIARLHLCVFFFNLWLISPLESVDLAAKWMSCDFYAKNSKIWHFLAIGSRSGLLRGLFLLCTCDFGNIFWFYSEKPGVFFGSGADPLFSEKQVFWKYWKFLGISSLFPLGFSNNLHFGFFFGFGALWRDSNAEDFGKISALTSQF